VPGLGQLNFAFYRRARRLVFRAAVFFLAGFLFATFFLRRGARPIARFTAGVTCLTLARPACRAPLVDSSITSAAAFAAAPASLAISTPRCAASVIALFAFVVTLLTISMPLVGYRSIMRTEAARFPKIETSKNGERRTVRSDKCGPAVHCGPQRSGENAAQARPHTYRSR